MRESAPHLQVPLQSGGKGAGRLAQIRAHHRESSSQMYLIALGKPRAVRMSMRFWT